MKWELRSRMLLRAAANPLFVFVTAVFLLHVFLLCQYGSVRRNLPVIGVCLLFMLFHMIFYLIRYMQYKKNSKITVYRGIRIETDSVLLTDAEGGQCSFVLKEIRQVQKKKKQYYIFLSHSRYLQVETSKENKETQDYIALKLSSPGIGKRFLWKCPALFFLVFSIVASGVGIVRSAIPYHGALSWVLDEYKNRKQITLEKEHDNIYETGFEGVLEDIRAEVELPETLCLATSFNLHFLPDGTIDTIDTMLLGFDEQGRFVNSYLISYDRDKSSQISVWLNGQSEDTYDPEKDFGALVEAMNVIDIEKAVSGWEEKVYGILYYGIRNWNLSDGGIIFINEKGETWEQNKSTEVLRGYSVSVFCPESDGIQPYRFIYRKEAEKPGEAETMNRTEEAELENRLEESEEIEEENLKEDEEREMFPLSLEEYGIVTETEEKFYSSIDEEQEVYSYSIEEFYFYDTFEYAGKVNKTLSEIYEKYANYNKVMGEKRKHYTAKDYVEGMGVEYEKLISPVLSYVDDRYVSICFNKVEYYGGARPYAYRVSYTIDIATGEEVSVEKVSGKTMEELMSENVELDESYTGMTSGYYLNQNYLVFYRGQLGNWYEEIWIER